jgi:hypothetical protein
MMRVHTEVNSGKLAPCKLGYQQAVGIRNRKLPRGLLQLQLPRVPHCIACGSGMDEGCGGGGAGTGAQCACDGLCDGKDWSNWRKVKRFGLTGRPTRPSGGL